MASRTAADVDEIELAPVPLPVSASDKDAVIDAPLELSDQTNYLPRKQTIVVFLGLSVALILSQIDQTIVATILPSISKDLPSSGYTSSWIGSAFLLSATAFQILWSRWSDIFGRKVCLLAALTIFWLGSLACSIAQTMLQLILFRAFAGIGGGAIVLFTMIITSDVVPARERELYASITSTAMMVSVGPILGGVIGQRASWRIAFYINIPIGFLSIVAIYFFLPLRPVEGSIKAKLLHVDYVGAILVLAASTSIIYALTVGGLEFAWSAAPPIATLTAGCATAVGFVLYEWKIPRTPLLPVRMFRILNVSIICSSWFAIGFVFYATLYFIPQFYQVVKGYDALTASLLLLPLICGQFAVVALSGYLMLKSGKWKTQYFLGSACYAVGLGLFSLVNQHSTLVEPIIFLSLCGIGSGVGLSVSSIALQSSVARKDIAVAVGTRNFLRWLGGSLSICVAVAITDSQVVGRVIGVQKSQISAIQNDPTILHQQLERANLTTTQAQELITAFQSGYQLVWQICAGLLAIATLSVLFLKEVSLDEPDVVEQKEKSRLWLSARKAKARGKAK